jgi:HK97 family phage major capsid protein
MSRAEATDRFRAAQILNLAREHNALDLAERAILAGHSETQFRTLLLERMGPQYSFSRVMQGLMRGRVDGYEAEVSQELQRESGVGSGGTLVPWHVVAPSLATRDFTVGTAAEAGNLKATNVAREVGPPLTPRSIMDLGVTVLPGLTGDVLLTRVGTGISLSWLSETGLASEVSPATTTVTLAPRRTGGFIQVSKQALIQGNGRTEAAVRAALEAGAIAILESGAINGTGSSNQPRGVRNTAGIGSVVGGTNGANISWSHIVGLEAAPAASNAREGFGGYLVNSTSRRYLKVTPRGTNLDFMWSPESPDRPLNGYRAVASNTVPSNLTKGTSNGICSSLIFSADWSHLVLGLFGPGIELFYDPYSQKAAGMTEVMCTLYCDVAITQPAAFATMDDALTP